MTQIERFIGAGRPANWFSLADEFRLASEMLFENIKKNTGITNTIIIRENDSGCLEYFTKCEISRAYICNIGISIENLIKGLLIAKNPKYIESGKLDEFLKTHTIIEFVDSLEGVEFSNPELELLKVLSEAIPYWSKFPMPLKYSDLKDEISMSCGMRNTFMSLFNKLLNELNRELEEGEKDFTKLGQNRKEYTHLNCTCEFNRKKNSWRVAQEKNLFK